MLCLQERKASSFSEAMSFSLWGNNEVQWVHKEGHNGGGGILSMWHKSGFKCESQEVGDGYIALFGQHLKTSSKVAIINVYYSCVWEEKK